MTAITPRFEATIFDYGAGNLHSLAKAIERCGVRVTIATDPFRALDTDLVVLPGVGAFGHAAARLAPARDAWRERIAAGLPCLGVCLGMQLLLDDSEEGAGRGLGLVAGRVTRLAARRVPHMGWNTIDEAQGSDRGAAASPASATAPPRGEEVAALDEGPARAGAAEPLLDEGAAPAGATRARLDRAYYFAHGYACRPTDESVVGAWCVHETDRFAAVIAKGAVLGVQFHPEKSSRAGAAFLASYLDGIALRKAFAAERIEPASAPCAMGELDAENARGAAGDDPGRLREARP